MNLEPTMLTHWQEEEEHISANEAEERLAGGWEGN